VATHPTVGDRMSGCVADCVQQEMFGCTEIMMSLFAF
jgi:hypothetical protein